MITKIQGTLNALQADRAYIDPGHGLTYELLLPAFAVVRLGGSIDQVVTLHTLQFMESQNQGATIFPRLAGFMTPEDKSFFELFVTCKGIGHRKALRAMVLASTQIAIAIEERDLSTLQTLPEVGKRTAETIVATLRGKVDRFLNAPPGNFSPRDPSTLPTQSPPAPVGGEVPPNRPARAALDTLVMLGERRADALQWIDQVMSTNDPPRDTESILAAVYQIKGK